MNWKERVTGLAEEHGPMVFSTAYRILGNVDDAQDAQQDVFLRLLNSWTVRLTADRVANWGAYLRVAAVRGAIERLRHRRLSADCLLPLEEREVESCRPDPRRSAIARQRAAMLREAIATLPAREARVFALRFFEECSYREIAEQMGLSVNRVGVLIQRARQRLRAALEPRLGEPEKATHVTPSLESRGEERSHVA